MNQDNQPDEVLQAIIEDELLMQSRREHDHAIETMEPADK